MDGAAKKLSRNGILLEEKQTAILLSKRMVKRGNTTLKKNSIKFDSHRNLGGKDETFSPNANCILDFSCPRGSGHIGFTWSHLIPFRKRLLAGGSRIRSAVFGKYYDGILISEDIGIFLRKSCSDIN